ncbi:MAG: hypothetical protein ABIH11_03845 [Candidatus Altiarchaeota archaeon]
MSNVRRRNEGFQHFAAGILVAFGYSVMLVTLPVAGILLLLPGTFLILEFTLYGLVQIVVSLFESGPR